ncbi:MAG: hypothetical protein J4F34_05510, partial [Gemmatimonadetes bacterium]|nr:hypothetical protein [Gemmatimonadota bacterium]
MDRRAKQSSGDAAPLLPWEGSYILGGKPTITAAAMYAHNDLESGSPEYPLDEECGVSGDSIGVYALNDKC